VPVAFCTCYQSDGVLYLDDTGYDAAWRKHQPGKVLLYLMIEDLSAFNTPSWMDFGYCDNEHKRFFASYPEANVYLVRKKVHPTIANGRARGLRTHEPRHAKAPRRSLLAAQGAAVASVAQAGAGHHGSHLARVNMPACVRV